MRNFGRFLERYKRVLTPKWLVINVFGTCGRRSRRVVTSPHIRASATETTRRRMELNVGRIKDIIDSQYCQNDMYTYRCTTRAAYEYCISCSWAHSCTFSKCIESFKRNLEKRFVSRLNAFCGYCFGTGVNCVLTYNAAWFVIVSRALWCCCMCVTFLVT